MRNRTTSGFLFRIPNSALRISSDMPTLAHFSDIHLTAKPLGWRPRDWFSKRISGWVNVRVLGRGRRFQLAPTVAVALMADIRQRQPDAIVFSGDASHLGFESEMVAAAAAVGVGDESLPPAVTVPGNHDYYTTRAAVGLGFERNFAPWQEGKRLDGFHYPFARKVAGVWLIGVCSATANRWRGDASGAVGAVQLANLRDLCDALDDGPRVLVTHYPLRTADGRVEPLVHRLRDHEAALQTAKACGISLWLHGHIHTAYVLKPSPAIPFPVACAGSATQNNRWSYYEHVLGDGTLVSHRREYDPTAGAFREVEVTEVEMPVPQHQG